MKKIVVVLVSLVVVVLVIVGNVFAQDKTPEASIPNPSLSSRWKLVFTGSDGTTYYFNTRKITYLPKGIVKVWTLWVPRGELRRKIVNALKQDLLSKGEDPNNAKRVWYEIQLYKFNCKTHQTDLLEVTAYSFGKGVLDDFSFQHEKWNDIVPGTVTKDIEKFVCKYHKEKK